MIGAEQWGLRGSRTENPQGIPVLSPPCMPHRDTPQVVKGPLCLALNGAQASWV